MSSACEVWFYQLERSGPDEALPRLLEKTLEKGWRALVRTPDASRVEHLDQLLWTWRDDSFLPHGLADEPLAERQPILIGVGDENANDAKALFLLDGAEPGDLGGLERCILLFDGRDEDQLTAARGHWKTLKAKGNEVSYWVENPGRGWEKKA